MYFSRRKNKQIRKVKTSTNSLSRPLSTEWRKIVLPKDINLPQLQTFYLGIALLGILTRVRIMKQQKYGQMVEYNVLTLLKFCPIMLTKSCV